VQVVTDSVQLAAVLSPLRMRVLEEMTEPQSATTLAPRLGVTRQALNYHLRELEREGFVEVAEERQRRGCVERVMRVTSRAFVVSPTVLGRLGDDPSQARDRFSSAYLLATASHLIRDIAILQERARAVDERLATFTMETSARFRSPAAFRSFVEELAASVARLAAKYDDPSAGSRRFRLVFGSHPAITKSDADAADEARRKRGRRRPSRRNSVRRAS
jgi:DNA-binding transcriptional ArsR family regulator